MINSDAITHLQSALTDQWHQTTPRASEVKDELERLIIENHLRNFLLWHEEDIARREDIGHARIYQAKRAIDRYNQQRNDFIEKIDKHLVASLKPSTEGCPFNSETPAMMIDRLSILALKEFHMREETEREDAASEHVCKCSKKLIVVTQQIADLALALNTLVEEVKTGTRSFRVYFQFKMYNDPELNPELRKT